MGKGRPRKSDDLKALEGTLRADRAMERNVGHGNNIEIPKPPRDLGKFGKDAWKQVMQELYDSNRLRLVYIPIVVRYCVYWERFMFYSMIINKNGSVMAYKNDEGATTTVQQIPEVAMERAAADQCAKIERQLGIEPPKQVFEMEKKTKSKLAKFLEVKNK